MNTAYMLPIRERIQNRYTFLHHLPRNSMWWILPRLGALLVERIPLNMCSDEEHRQILASKQSAAIVWLEYFHRRNRKPKVQKILQEYLRKYDISVVFIGNELVLSLPSGVYRFLRPD